jgi:gamma-butyrobetaine dioxygenase
VGTAPLSSVDGLLEALGSLRDHAGDDVVPTLAHLLQTADALAAAHPGDPGLVVAGLVHDIATGLDPGCADHARAGAALVAPLLGERVGQLVAGHAEAKRYLVTVEPSYARALSPDSTATLARQGGAMTGDEVRSFARGPHRADLVALRRADDGAKVPGRAVRPLGEWRAVLDEVARRPGPP